MGVTERPRSLNLIKAIAMAICPIIVHFSTLRARSMHDVAWRGMWICVRSKDAQKQLARTSLTTSLIYNAQITSTTANQTTTKNYIGLTEGTFKQRYTQHKSTFTHRKLSNSTELSKYMWQLKDSNISFTTKWSIIARACPLPQFKQKM